MSSQLPIRVEENLQSCIVIVFKPFAGSERDIHDLVQLPFDSYSNLFFRSV